MNFPVKSPARIVPIPIPFKALKKKNESKVAIKIKVISKYIFIVPNLIAGFLQIMAKNNALTTPSPGITITFGATSIHIPRASMKQPKIKIDICNKKFSG